MVFYSTATTRPINIYLISKNPTNRGRLQKDKRCILLSIEIFKVVSARTVNCFLSLLYITLKTLWQCMVHSCDSLPIPQVSMHSLSVINSLYWPVHLVLWSFSKYSMVHIFYNYCAFTKNCSCIMVVFIDIQMNASKTKIMTNKSRWPTACSS